MSWRDRFWGRDDKIFPVRLAVAGEGAEADRLVQAYSAVEGIDLLGGSPRPLAEMESVLRTAGLQAVEIVAPPETRAELAAEALRAGLMASLDAPLTVNELKELSWLSRAYQTPLRFRLLPLYYPPYQEVKRLLRQDTVGEPFSLKLMVRVGQGAALPPDIHPGQWLLEREIGYLALAEWLLGPVEKVYAKWHNSVPARPASALVMWKYKRPHCFGYLQLDFCPFLHVRTFTDPVHRALEITGVGGLLFATRGEGQLLRQPPVIVRGRSNTTALEMVPEDWREVYLSLARETVSLFQRKRAAAGMAELALSALNLVQAARKSGVSGEEARVFST